MDGYEALRPVRLVSRFLLVISYSSKRYGKSLEELFSRHPSVQSAGFSDGAYKPGLSGMESLDAALGYPSRALRCIHIAGTNGKGSVASMLCSALAAEGFRTGLYTSPHLYDFRERMKILHPSGRLEMPSKAWVLDFLVRNGALFEDRSFFEITTGMAFCWFREKGAERVVVEAGLGGRLDSTNIITPDLSVVTSIGLDHCLMLGSTVQEIAFEKAGIFKAGVPALAGECEPSVAKVFEEVAARTGSPLFFADAPQQGEDELLAEMDLQGPCQKANLRTALKALSLLGFPEVPRTALARTAERTAFHGRWEKLCANPEVIADIAHNPPALKVNFGRLEALKRPLYLVFGIMADKDLDSVASLIPAGTQCRLAAPSTPRALAAGELESRLGSLRPDLSCRSYPSVALALESAMQDAGKEKDALVYVGGSTFVVSEAAASLKVGK